MYANKTEIQGLMLEDTASQDIKALAPISKIKQATAIDFYSGEIFIRAYPFKQLWEGMSYLSFLPTQRISFTFFVDFLLQKVQKCHPPAELQSFPYHSQQNHKNSQKNPTWIF